MVTWNQIAAECDGYKAGFVSVFRSHEGEATDEKDGQGRTVKVTANSFAQHAGINPKTFRNWLQNGSATRSAPSDQPVLKAIRMIRTPEDREALVREIAKVDPDLVFEVAAEGLGQTRSVAPRSNAEDIFGPFVKVRHALGQLRRVLPDYTAGDDIRDEAEDTIADLRGTAKIVRDWLDGQDVAGEVEKWLQTQG